MLLLPPPLSRDEWIQLDRTSPDFLDLLLKYAEDYNAKVLNLPSAQLTNVRAWITRGYDRPITPESFDEIAVRQVEEVWWEASSKAAALVVMVELAKELDSRQRLSVNTRSVINVCRSLIPFVLLTAIDDHFALLTGNSASTYRGVDQRKR